MHRSALRTFRRSSGRAPSVPAPLAQSEHAAARRPSRARAAHASALVTALCAAAACGGNARLPLAAGIGPSPQLPAPRTALIPTVQIAPAVGWPAGRTPTAATGTAVTAFATGLNHPRWLAVLPNGDVLVAETNGPPRRDDTPGIKGWFMRRFMKMAGAAVTSADRITLLRDTTGDGVADVRAVFATAADGLHSPFGMALVGDTLYVANTDAVVHFPYRANALRVGGPARVLTALPAGSINHHWTKSLIASPNGRTLYVGVGANSNAGERGIAAEEGRAAVWAIDRATGGHHVFASGLRNPVGMAWASGGALWVAVNERDELGGDLVPDYMTAVRENAFYGWPYSYFGSHVDVRAKPQRPDLVAAAVVPDYALGPHTASLGLAASRESASLPARWAEGMFVGQHGSWNRKPRSGYQVVFIPFSGGRPTGQPEKVLGGFLDAKGHAMGRPVGVAIDGRGALLVADDVGNAIWRVTASRLPAR